MVTVREKWTGTNKQRPFRSFLRFTISMDWAVEMDGSIDGPQRLTVHNLIVQVFSEDNRLRNEKQVVVMK